MDWGDWVGTGISLAGVVLQLVFVVLAARLRREAQMMLEHAKKTHDESGRWLRQAQGVLAYNEGLLREHGFLRDDEPTEAIQ